MNGETLKFIEEYMNSEDNNTFPPEVPKSHRMLMYAIRHSSLEAKKERGVLERKITDLSDLFLGKNPDRSNGVIEQIKTNTRFRKTFTWILIIVTTAFLGGLGKWIWGLVEL